MTDKEFVHNFWSNVKKILKQKDIIRKDFCGRIGVKEKTLSAMICRDTPPDILLLTRIRDALDIECTELLYSLQDADRAVFPSGPERELLECLRNSTLDEDILIKMIIAIMAQAFNVAVPNMVDLDSLALEKIELTKETIPETEETIPEATESVSKAAETAPKPVKKQKKQRKSTKSKQKADKSEQEMSLPRGDGYLPLEFDEPEEGR